MDSAVIYQTGPVYRAQWEYREYHTSATTVSMWRWCRVTYDDQGREAWLTWIL